MNEEYQKIADKYVKGTGDSMKDINPSNGEFLAVLKTFTEEEAKHSIEEATEKFKEWSQTSPIKRGLILMKAGEIMEKEVEE